MISSPAQELADLRLETEAYAEQVSRDFEELTWLRCLSDQLEACDAASTLGQVAEGILSELRSMIGAEAVLLVASGLGIPPVEPGPKGDCRIISTAGLILIDDAACRSLIASMAAETCDCPLIRNRIEPDCLPAGCSGVHSYMAVPVTRQEAQYGWLLALNRTHRAAGSASRDGRRVVLPGGEEFGTEEASLLHAA